MNAVQPPPPPSPPNSENFLGTSDGGGFRYAAGVSIGVLILITTITLASYYCTRSHHHHQLSRSQPSPANHNPTHDEHVIVELLGLDEATIKSYPKILYSEAKVKKKAGGDSTASCCSICLADYKGSDLLRQLPDCNHLFHVKCIDTWLRLNPTCPVCRTSPLPTPIATPLAEVMPLAAAAASLRH